MKKLIYLTGNYKNRNDLRKAYFSLLKELHPDNGGSVDACQILNNEYETLFQTLPAAGEKESEAEKQAAATLDKEIREALEKVIRFRDINIEVVGTWIWIDGITFPIKEELKAAGYTWSRNRKKWHYTPYETPVYYKGKKKTFESLRRMYGSSEVETEPAPAIA